MRSEWGAAAVAVPGATSDAATSAAIAVSLRALMSVPFGRRW